MDELYDDWYEDDEELCCPNCGQEWRGCTCTEEEIKAARAQIAFDQAVAEAEAQDDGDYGQRDWNEFDGIDVNKRFAVPGGDSALFPATPTNPRVYPCPDCGRPNTLTRMDKLQGYCCDGCANQRERGF